ncbi:uncharacterized protein TrAtP1_007408 [Trichoderma atroviride]|uniref:uncharacterized protein n=1 Tax=Hypocrea atroviridis TaxID=63577 RepID=UPI00332AB0B1|nr:hypothetical protein TrAtP1_007408 [Trichoderma atroviride]
MLKHFEEYLKQPLNPENSLQEQEQKVELQETPKHHEQDYREQDHDEQDHPKQDHQEKGHQEKNRGEKVHTQGYQEKDRTSPECPEQVQQHSQRDINEAWQAVLQGLPEALEYYFSKAMFTVPSGDEVAVRDPPSLRGKQSGEESRKVSKD